MIRSTRILVDFPTMENQCAKEQLELVECNATTDIRKLKEREEGNEQTKGKEADVLSLHVSHWIFFLTSNILIETVLIVPGPKSCKDNKVFNGKTSR